MKLTQKKLRQIIKEELSRLVEAPSFYSEEPPPGYHAGRPSRAELVDDSEFEYIGDEGDVKIYRDPVTGDEGTYEELSDLRANPYSDDDSPF